MNIKQNDDTVDQSATVRMQWTVVAAQLQEHCHLVGCTFCVSVYFRRTSYSSWAVLCDV